MVEIRGVLRRPARFQVASMPKMPNKKEEHRFYLFPGQGRNRRKRQMQILLAALAAGLVVAGALGALLWFINRP